MCFSLTPQATHEKVPGLSRQDLEMTRLSACAAALVLLGTTAHADVSPSEISISSFNPANAVAPTSSIEGAGVKVGEGTVIRPVVGLETGFISNVFYEDGTPQGAGLLRVLAQFGIASLGEARLNSGAGDEEDQPSHGSFAYRADLRLAYDMMLSGDDTVAETGGLNVGASLRGIVNPRGRLAFQFEDRFDRLIRAANYETNVNTNRDINSLRLLMNYQPRDRSLSGYLYYTNTIDVFERSDQAFANRMSNRIGIRPTWRFLPQTQAYLDFSFGNITPLSDSATKSNSYPLLVRAGIATLLSLKTTLNLDAGYTNGFYSVGPSYSAPVIGAQLGYRYSPLGRATVGYALIYEDSINANFYRDHVARITIQQLFNPFVLMLQPEVHVRQYRGVTVAVPDLMGAADTRDDLIVAVVGGIHYNYRNWLLASINYRFATVQTDFVDPSGGSIDDPSFIRHELLLGMRAAL